MIPRSFILVAIGMLTPLSVRVGLGGLERGLWKRMHSVFEGENLKPLVLHQHCRLFIVFCKCCSASGMDTELM